MAKSKLILILILSLLFSLNCSYRPLKHPTNRQLLQQELDQFLSAPDLKNAVIGIYVENPRTREVLYAQNSHTLFVPASNLKLFTTCTALALLKPDFRWKTYLLTDGLQNGNTLTGNLIIRGTGDPTFYKRFYAGNSLAVFQEWARKLKARGIRKIEGNLVGDDNLFEDTPLGFGWSWDDEPYYYSAQTSALCFNDNCVDVAIVPAKKIGKPPQIILYPPTDYVTIINQLTTTHPDSASNWDFWRERDKNVFKFYGQVSRSEDTLWTSIAIVNPTLFTVTILKQVLEAEGLEVSGNPIDIDDTTIDTIQDTLLVHLSPPLSEVVKVINKRSHNLYAEQVLKTMGLYLNGQGSWKKGLQVEKRFLSQIGIPPAHIELVDGSGLSRHNLVTPYQISTILRYAYNSSFREIFLESLPVGGMDGTLKNRFKGSNATGHVFAKTGYVNHVRTLSGYLETISGDILIFSLMINHYNIPTSRINDLQDQIVTRLYNLF